LPPGLCAGASRPRATQQRPLLPSELRRGQRLASRNGERKTLRGAVSFLKDKKSILNRGWRGSCDAMAQPHIISTTVTSPGRTFKRADAIPDSLLRELRHHLVTRQVSSGISLLDANQHLIAQLAPDQSNASALTGAIAQWVDIGYRGPEFLEQVLSKFPKEQRSELPLSGYLQLRMAEGLLALLRDHPDEALRHFDLVLLLQEEFQDKAAVAIAHFWNARCHRKKGEYDEALRRSAVGRELAQALGFPT